MNRKIIENILEIELTGYDRILQITNEKDRTSKVEIKEAAQDVKQLCRDTIELIREENLNRDLESLKLKAVESLLRKYHNNEIYLDHLLTRLKLLFNINE